MNKSRLDMNTASASTPTIAATRLRSGCVAGAGCWPAGHFDGIERDLYPVILTLMRWGDEHLAGDGEPPLVLEHQCGHRLVAKVVCEACGEPAAVGTAWPARPAGAVSSCAESGPGAA